MRASCRSHGSLLTSWPALTRTPKHAPYSDVFEVSGMKKLRVESRLITCNAEVSIVPQPAKARKTPERPSLLRPGTLPDKDDLVWQNCAIIVDKPLTWTSHDVCAKLKRALNVKKIGHAGTLDPLATGVLIICIGKGTKSSEKFMADEKVYSGELRLGEATPSYDAETDPCDSAPWAHITDGDLQTTADMHFTGTIQQVCTQFE
jgi:hypothetical protein